MGTLAWELELGNFGSGTLAWDVCLGNFSLGSLAWELWVGNFGLRSLAWKLWLKDLRLGASKGNQAGGIGLPATGESAGAGYIH